MKNPGQPVDVVAFSDTMLKFQLHTGSDVNLFSSEFAPFCRKRFRSSDSIATISGSSIVTSRISRVKCYNDKLFGCVGWKFPLCSLELWLHFLHF